MASNIFELCFWARALGELLTRSAAHCTMIFYDSRDTSEPASGAVRGVFTRIPVQAKGKSHDGRKFSENSQTIVINAHGGLLYLQEELELGRRTRAHESRDRRRAGVPRGVPGRHFRKRDARRRGISCRRARISGASNSRSRIGLGVHHAFRIFRVIRELTQAFDCCFP